MSNTHQTRRQTCHRFNQPSRRTFTCKVFACVFVWFACVRVCEFVDGYVMAHGFESQPSTGHLIRIKPKRTTNHSFQHQSFNQCGCVLFASVGESVHEFGRSVKPVTRLTL